MASSHGGSRRQSTFKPLAHTAFVLPAESHLFSTLVHLVLWEMEQEASCDSETEVTQKLCKTVAEEGGNRNITS